MIIPDSFSAVMLQFNNNVCKWIPLYSNNFTHFPGLKQPSRISVTRCRLHYERYRVEETWVNGKISFLFHADFQKKQYKEVKTLFVLEIKLPIFSYSPAKTSEHIWDRDRRGPHGPIRLRSHRKDFAKYGRAAR